MTEKSIVSLSHSIAVLKLTEAHHKLVVGYRVVHPSRICNGSLLLCSCQRLGSDAQDSDRDQEYNAKAPHLHNSAVAILPS